MQCKQVIQLLDQHRGDSTRLDYAAQAHLRTCDSCSAVAADRQLDALLAAIPVPKVREGFAETALEFAWLNREARKPEGRLMTGSWLAIAASLLLAIGVVMQSQWPGMDSTISGSPEGLVSAVPGLVRNVDILMVSAEALPNAQITLQMDDSVSLAGYPGRKELRWATPLIAGNNQLSLPLELQGSNGGSVRVSVESDGAFREMLLTVVAMDAASEESRAAQLVI